MTIGSFEAKIDLALEDAVERVTEALKAEGFGILTRIDVHKAFAEKLGVDFRPYAILGACNPNLAHAALTEAPEIGLLLPCNVVVEEIRPGHCLVRIADPASMMVSAGEEVAEKVSEIGQDAYDRLHRVAAGLSE